MSDTVQRLGVEFFGTLNEKSILDVVEKIKDKFSTQDLSSIFSGMASKIADSLKSQVTPAANDTAKAVSNIGEAAKIVGEKVSTSFSQAKTSTSGLTGATYDLIKGFEKTILLSTDLSNAGTRVADVFNRIKSSKVAQPTGTSVLLSGTMEPSPMLGDLSQQGTKVEGSYNKIRESVSNVVGAISGLSAETGRLVSLTDKLAESFARIDYKNMIRPDQMELFRSKFSEINKQVEVFTAQLAKISKPTFQGIQQEAIAISTQIESSLKSLPGILSAGDATNTSVRIQELINLLRQLQTVAGGALASEFKAGAEALDGFRVKANMSVQEVSKLQLSLLELQGAKKLVAEQIANVKSQYDNLDKSSQNYRSTVTTLNKQLMELMKTEQSVNSVLSETKRSIADIVPVVGKLEAAFNLISILDKINPPEIHRAAAAWKSSAENLSMYMKQLANLMHIKLEGTEQPILAKSKEIESIIMQMQKLSATPRTQESANELTRMQGAVQGLLVEYTTLERTMLGGAIEKVTKSLGEFGVTAGMSYGQIRKLNHNVLEFEKIAELLRTQLRQLNSEYQGLGAITDVNRVAANKISAEYAKVSTSLGAVEQKIRVLKGGFADAARGLRMYWEGFAPMLKSQAAWLAGGALLFGVMYKIQDAVKNFVAFEDRINRIRIVGEGTKKEMAELRHGLLGLAETAGQTTIALAEAAFYLVKYGLSIKQINDVLPSLARLTTVAGGTIQENAKGVISLLNAYEMAYEDADRLANALTVTLNKSALEMGDLSTILSTVASSSAQLHQPVEQILALSAAMSNLGIKPSTIGTSIRQLIGTLAQIEAPTQRFSDNILRKVTIALGSNEKALEALNPAYHSLVDILLLLNKAGITTHDMFAGLNLRAASGTAAMMNAKDSILDLVIAIRTQNILTAQFAQVTNSAEMSLKNLSNTLESTITKILGGGTERGLARVSQTIHGIVKAIGWLFEGLQGTIARIGILAAGFIYLTKAVAGATVSLTIFGRVVSVTLAPWMKWLAVISMVIAGLQLLAMSWSAVADEQEGVANKSKEAAEKYSDRIKELRSQITLNNQLAESNLADKSAIELKNAVMEREIELMQKKRIEAQKAQIMELAVPAGKALAGFISRSQEKQGIKETFGPMQESEFGGRGMIPRQSTLERTVDYEQIIKDMEADRTGEGQLVINFLKTLDEETIKDQDMQIQKLARYYIAREKAKIPREDKVDSEEIKKHKRTMDALDAELAALIKKNKALRESETIQAQIDEQAAKLSIVKRDIGIGTDPAKQRDLEEEAEKINVKMKELEFSKADAQKREAIATMEYYSTIKKSAIDQEVVTKHLERAENIQAQINKLEIDRADIVAQQGLPNKLKISEMEDLEKRRLSTILQIEEKRVELVKESFAEAERQYIVRDMLIGQSIEAQTQDIEMSIKLSSREKETQKLQVERLGIMTKISNIAALIYQAEQGVGVDKSKKEELSKTFKELNHDLKIVDVKIKDSKEKQRDFWQAIKEYIASAEEAVKSFSYNMGKAFTDQLQSSFADLGKAMVYQNADTIKQLRGQRDEDLSNIKEKYDEELLALEDSLANGKTTYFDYYEKLQDLNDKYHKDIKSSQDQFEKNMKDSLITISSLWEKFWRAMIDAAINMMAQQAVSGIFKSIGSMFTSGSTSTGWAQSAGGGLNTGTTPLVTNFKLPKTVRTENSLGVRTSDYMNRSGEARGRDINIINVVDPSSIPTLSPDDVINVINFDIARRGQTYKSLTINR